MDNPQEILSTLEATVDRLKVIYAEGGETPLDDGVAEVRQLCISVEEVLRYQQKDRLSFWGERRDYWHFLSEAVGKINSLEDCVRRAQCLPQFTTTQGKGRALIRECLVQQLLADCIQNCLSNHKRTKEWYHSSAIVITEVFAQRLFSALYDLCDVTFDLPSDGLDLDETWPAFVIKSFRNLNGTSDVPTQSLSPFQKVLGGNTMVAKVAEKELPKVLAIGSGQGRPTCLSCLVRGLINRRQMISFVQLLEKAVEEEPSEVFIRKEIPFDLELVGTLIADIHACLRADHIHNDHTFGGPPGLLSELKVTVLDDITSCLSLLKSCVTAWMHDISRKAGQLVDENKLLKDKHADLEMQLEETMQESNDSEISLVKELQACREELRSVVCDMQTLTAEKEDLNLLFSQRAEKLKEVEDMNFSLEEQLVRCGMEEDGKRQRAYTVLEYSLQEKDQELEDLTSRLEQAEASNHQLLLDLSDSRTKIENQIVIHESHVKSDENRIKFEEVIRDLREKEENLKKENSKLQSWNQSQTCDLAAQKIKMESELNERLELESKKWTSLERERDMMKVELAEASSIVANETSSLKFKLSSLNIELQQAKEHSSKKDRVISCLRGNVQDIESQAGKGRECLEEAERQVDTLKLELENVESVLKNQREEISSLHEQAKDLSSNQERATLKRQAEWDSTHQRLDVEGTELRRQMEGLTGENMEIKKAFKKLLKQKVTLWQHAENLEQDHIAMGTWVESKNVTVCMSCNLVFTMFARKHHCRSCGNVFCIKCCGKKIPLAVSKDLSRVCDKCYDQILKKRIPFASSFINSALLDSGTESLIFRQPAPQASATPSSGEGYCLSRSPRSVGGSSDPVSPTPRTRRDMAMSRNSLNIERTIGRSGNSLQAKLLIQNQTSDLEELSDSQFGSRTNLELEYSSDDDNSTTTDTYKVLSKCSLNSENTIFDTIVSDPTENHTHPVINATSTLSLPMKGEDFQSTSLKSISSAEYSVDPELRVKEAERMLRQDKTQVIILDNGQEANIRSVQGRTADDGYCIIDTEISTDAANLTTSSCPMNPTSVLETLDALASKLSLLESNLVKEDGEGDWVDEGGRRNALGVVSPHCGEMKEVLLGGGESHSVKLLVDRCRTSVMWEFSTEPKGIAFGISYQEEDKPGLEVEVLPLKRCSSHKTTLTGEFCTQKKGIYILNFDNCHSKFSERKLFFKVWTKRPS